jgi:protein TonB
MPQSFASAPFHPPRVASRRELAFVVGLTALLHAGAAVAALNTRDAAPKLRVPSRVEIQIAHAERTRPPLTPPPPPPALRPPPKPLAPALVHNERLEPRTEASHEPQSALPPDTGSSLPSSADGALFAGSGGLGTTPPAPLVPAVPPAPAAVPAQLIPAHEGANYLKNPRPEYPGLARRQGWEGTTLLRVQVAENGRPLSVQVQRTSGRDTLDDAAKRAVSKWSFVPATRGDSPVAGWVTVPIVFRLQ